MEESMSGLKRTCRCAELSTENVGQTGLRGKDG